MSTILTIFLGVIVGRACKRKIEMIKLSGYFGYEVKSCQNLHQRRRVKIYMCSDTLNGKDC